MEAYFLDQIGDTLEAQAGSCSRILQESEVLKIPKDQCNLRKSMLNLLVFHGDLKQLVVDGS